MSDNWKYIEGFGTRYKIYSDGRLVSTKNNKPMKWKAIGNNHSLLLNDGEKSRGVTKSKLLEEYFQIATNTNNIVEDLPDEIWVDVKNYEGLYKISNKSRIKRIEKVYVGEYLLKLHIARKGHYNVSLSKNNVSKTFAFHNLLAKHFIPNPRKRKMVIHLNGIKTINGLDNLKWAHNSEAQQMAIDLGLKVVPLGGENPTSRMVDQYVSDAVTFIKRWECITDVERELGIWHNNISKVCRGKRMNAGGYHWKYVESEIDSDK